MIINVWTTIIVSWLRIFARLLPESFFPSQVETAFISFGSYVSYLNNFINVSTIFTILNYWIAFQLAIWTLRSLQIVFGFVLFKKVNV